MKFSSVACTAVMLMTMACASQRDVVSLDSRLGEIELREAELKRDRQALEAARRESEQALREQSASLRAGTEELREEIRLLKGRVEELEHSLGRQQQAGTASDQIKNEVQDSLAETDRRVERIEQYLGLEPTAGAAASGDGAAAGSKIVAADRPTGALSEEDLYRQAKHAFDQGDSDGARKDFEEFMRRYPKSPNADNAQFWIGEIYYRDKWYEKAILEYQKVIENYPNGNKVAASLLKQGLAFFNIGDKTNARLILEELVRKYPKTNEADIAGKKLQSM